MGRAAAARPCQAASRPNYQLQVQDVCLPLSRRLARGIWRNNPALTEHRRRSLWLGRLVSQLRWHRCFEVRWAWVRAHTTIKLEQSQGDAARGTARMPPHRARPARILSLSNSEQSHARNPQGIAGIADAGDPSRGVPAASGSGSCMSALSCAYASSGRNVARLSATSSKEAA
jgi:hypothetical protein